MHEVAPVLPSVSHTQMPHDTSQFVVVEHHGLPPMPDESTVVHSSYQFPSYSNGKTHAVPSSTLPPSVTHSSHAFAWLPAVQKKHEVFPAAG